VVDTTAETDARAVARDLGGCDACGATMASAREGPELSTQASQTTRDLDLGPVDLVVIGYPPGAPMTGEAVPLLMDLVERRLIRVLDVLFVTKDEDGTFGGFDAQGLGPDQLGDFFVFDGATSGLLGGDDVAKAAEALEPGTSAVMIVYENRWAAPFIAAVRRNGGVLIAAERIGVQDLMDALDAAEAGS
jgi:hypothetical protein